MPIVDGLTSTKMIRAFEREQKASGLLTTAHRGYRIPIIAVSASLVEREKDTYVNAGFDGWILKPIDFKRLETLLRGIVDDRTREETLYVPGLWERGGWFHRKASPVLRQDKVEHVGGLSNPEPLSSGAPVGLGLGLELDSGLGRVLDPWQTDGVDGGKTIPEMVDSSHAKGIAAPTTSLLPLIQSQPPPVTTSSAPCRQHHKSASSASTIG